MVFENTKNPELISGSKSDLRLYALKTLRNSPKRHCKKLNTVQIMAISFDTYHG